MRTRIKGRNDIVEAIINIMGDDGPAPIRNYKATEKRPTAADQFYTDHQAQYDRRGPEEKNTVDRVQQHNNAYPKLCDELKKRGSLVKVTTIHVDKFGHNFDPKCRACAKMMTLMELRRRNIKAKCKYSAGIAKTKTRYRKKSRVCKTKVKKHKPMTKLSGTYIQLEVSKIWISKSCQCVPSGKNRSKLSVHCEVESSTLVNNVVNDKTVSKSPINPEPDPSMSSYNSFHSMEHEPMLE